ncbi:MAG: hypothetical protein IJ437_01705 [Clostridia bacterium]|nr:hypothetical protein [Clostridia bacterium]
MKKIKLPLLYMASFLCSILPVLVYFLVNFDTYVNTTPERFKLLFGAVLVAGILIVKAVGALKIKSGIVFFGVAFILAYLLESVVNDILIFSFLALVGEILSVIVRIFIKREKEKIATQKGEELIERALNKSSGRV